MINIKRYLTPQKNCPDNLPGQLHHPAIGGVTLVLNLTTALKGRVVQPFTLYNLKNMPVVPQ
jgi:hypothetical protein